MEISQHPIPALDVPHGRRGIQPVAEQVPVWHPSRSWKLDSPDQELNAADIALLTREQLKAIARRTVHFAALGAIPEDARAAAIMEITGTKDDSVVFAIHNTLMSI